MINDIKKQNPYFRLHSYLFQYKLKLIVSILFIFISVVGLATAPLFLGISINSLRDVLLKNFNNETIGIFFIFIILAGVSYLVRAVFSSLALKILIDVSQRAIYDIRKQIDEKLNKLPLNYYDTTTYGDILSRLTNDVNIIADSFQSNIYTTINAIFTIILVLMVMLKISGFLTFIGLLTLPLLIWLSSRISTKSEIAYQKQLKSTGELNGIVEEYYSGHNVVSLFGKEEAVIDGFEKVNDNLFKAGWAADFMAGSLYSINTAISNTSYMLVSVTGACISIWGGMSIGMIQAFTQYLTQFSEPISEFMQIVPIVQQISAASGRVFEFIDEEEEVADVENPKFPTELKGAVEFDHVVFGYVPHQTLIHDLNIKIKPGEKTAIVGPTGAGKTTLVNLIMRFYDVRSGAIRIDGIDVREMRRQDLRKIFGMVLQDTWLYSGTIMENIRYGRLDATDEEVINAAVAARADAFIRTLPNEYNFKLEEGASNIAQGQRQLITIARAMLSNCPILILDEATSSVDTRTEILIQEAMANIMKGKTSFVIAHRLSTIKDSNNILYMQDGDILEVGSHNELMAKNGLYAKLYNSQFAGEET